MPLYVSIFLWLAASAGAAYLACLGVNARLALEASPVAAGTGEHDRAERSHASSSPDDVASGEEDELVVPGGDASDDSERPEEEASLTGEDGSNEDSATQERHDDEPNDSVTVAEDCTSGLARDLADPLDAASTEDGIAPDKEELSDDASSEVTADEGEDSHATVIPAETEAPAATPIGSPRTWGIRAWAIALALADVTGALAYLASSHAVDWRGYVCALLCYAAVLAAAITDAKLRLIFNQVPLALMGARVLMLAYEFVALPDYALPDLIGSVVGCVACFLVFVLVRVFARGGIGGGDIKLIAAVGFVGGLYLAVYSLFFALLICSLTAAALMIFKHRSRKDSLPFAPFLYVGVSIALTLLLV